MSSCSSRAFETENEDDLGFRAVATSVNLCCATKDVVKDLSCDADACPHMAVARPSTLLASLDSHPLARAAESPEWLASAS